MERMLRHRRAAIGSTATGVALVVASGWAFAQPLRTLQVSLAAAYSNKPTLLAERAHLRSIDENVPTALAGWRPTVVLQNQAGYGWGRGQQFTSSFKAN